MNVYLPDELGERVKATEDLNVSNILQRALEAELANRAWLAEQQGEMHDVKLYAELYDGQHYEREVVFTGKHIATIDGGGVDAYLTAGGRIAIYIEKAEDLMVFDDLDQVRENLPKDIDHLGLIADISVALGNKQPVRLDI